jgi:hypothetical protein
VVNCLPVVPVKLPTVCLGVPAADRLGLRRRRRTFVHKSYLLRWVRPAAWDPAEPCSAALHATSYCQTALHRNAKCKAVCWVLCIRAACWAEHETC